MTVGLEVLHFVDFRRLRLLRFRWVDVPILLFCMSPFASSLVNHLGVQEGLSAAFFQVVTWGIPYAVGRLYFDDLPALRELDPAPAVMVLADVDDEQALVAEIDTDAAGIFTKDSEPEQFLEGIRAVLAGHRALGDNVMRHLIGRLNGTEASGARAGPMLPAARSRPRRRPARR